MSSQIANAKSNNIKNIQSKLSLPYLAHFVCGADASGSNKVFRSCTHGTLHIILNGIRLWKIVCGDQVLYLEPSLGPETEVPVGLIPSKETDAVLTSMLGRFEDEIEEAEKKEFPINVWPNKVHAKLYMRHSNTF